MLTKLILTCLLLAQIPGINAQSISEAISERVSRLDSRNTRIAGEHISAYAPLTQYYSANDFQPLWTDTMLNELLEAISFTATEGLLPSDYHQQPIAQLHATSNIDAASAADLDLLASDAFVMLQFHLLNGRVHPIAVDPNCHLEHQEGDLFSWLPQLRNSRQVMEAIHQARPRHVQYFRLLHAYIQLSSRQEVLPPWPARKETLRVGDSSGIMPVLRKILYLSGDLTDTDTTTAWYDSTLLEGVLRFQERHGLEVDGIVGKATGAALAQPFTDQMLQLQANMERWRWLPQQLPQAYGMVNIPAFTLDMVGPEGTVTFKVIVGRKDRKTPTFTARFSYLILNPTWTVPPTILREDVLPAVRRNPGYLTGKQIKVIAPDGRVLNPFTINWYSNSVYSYQYVQDPGPANSLGLIKFMMPNPYTVYLHDTPSKELFNRTSRTFSSGCIRVANPFQLATILLQDQPAWTADSMAAVVAGGVTTVVPLTWQPPLFVVYLTAWQQNNGTMYYYPDVYELDKALIQSLQQPAVVW